MNLRWDASKVTIKYSRACDWMKMGFCYGSTIYLGKEQYERWVREQTPNCLLYHEYRHYLQYQENGFLWQLFLMWFLPPILFYAPYRKKYEIDAYTVTLACRAARGTTMSDTYRNNLATVLSSWKYGWMMRKSEALKWIDETWASLVEG